MIINETIAQQTAQLLLQSNAIKLQPQQPFEWASGWKSPIYCDNRIVLSHPEIRNYMKRELVYFIKDHNFKPDVIAGVATGAIGLGMLIADLLNLPFVYVRSKAKKHGRQNQIEGVLPVNKKVLVVEDLISTGQSSLEAVKALREVEAHVVGMVAIFTYGFQMALDNFKKSNVDLHTLTNYESVLKKALDINYITDQQKRSFT